MQRANASSNQRAQPTKEDTAVSRIYRAPGYANCTPQWLEF